MEREREENYVESRKLTLAPGNNLWVKTLIVVVFIYRKSLVNIRLRLRLLLKVLLLLYQSFENC